MVVNIESTGYETDMRNEDINIHRIAEEGQEAKRIYSTESKHTFAETCVLKYINNNNNNNNDNSNNNSILDIENKKNHKTILKKESNVSISNSDLNKGIDISALPGVCTNSNLYRKPSKKSIIENCEEARKDEPAESNNQTPTGSIIESVTEIKNEKKKKVSFADGFTKEIFYIRRKGESISNGNITKRIELMKKKKMVQSVMEMKRSVPSVSVKKKDVIDKAEFEPNKIKIFHFKRRSDYQPVKLNLIKYSLQQNPNKKNISITQKENKRNGSKEVSLSKMKMKINERKEETDTICSSPRKNTDISNLQNDKKNKNVFTYVKNVIGKKNNKGPLNFINNYFFGKKSKEENIENDENLKKNKTFIKSNYDHKAEVKKKFSKNCKSELSNRRECYKNKNERLCSQISNVNTEVQCNKISNISNSSSFNSSNSTGLKKSVHTKRSINEMNNSHIFNNEVERNLIEDKDSVQNKVKKLIVLYDANHKDKLNYLKAFAKNCYSVITSDVLSQSQKAEKVQPLKKKEHFNFAESLRRFGNPFANRQLELATKDVKPITEEKENIIITPRTLPFCSNHSNYSNHNAKNNEENNKEPSMLKKKETFENDKSCNADKSKDETDTSTVTIMLVEEKEQEKKGEKKNEKEEIAKESTKCCSDKEGGGEKDNNKENEKEGSKFWSVSNENEQSLIIIKEEKEEVIIFKNTEVTLMEETDKRKPEEIDLNEHNKLKEGNNHNKITSLPQKVEKLISIKEEITYAINDSTKSNTSLNKSLTEQNISTNAVESNEKKNRKEMKIKKEGKEMDGEKEMKNKKKK